MLFASRPSRKPRFLFLAFLFGLMLGGGVTERAQAQDATDGEEEDEPRLEAGA
jgi:hypothetical protein